jgi:hypothetical protein
MWPGPLRWAGLLTLVAAGSGLLPACGGGDDGEPPADDRAPGAYNLFGTETKGTGTAVAIFIGELGQSDKTVCVADRERRRGTNVITVRDHSRQYDVSVVKYAAGHRQAAEALAARLGIEAVSRMDQVTPTLYPGIEVAAIIAGDYGSQQCPNLIP